MSSDPEIQSALFTAPPDDGVAVIAVTTSSQELDLDTVVAMTAYKYQGGRYVTFISDANVYLNFGAAAAGSVVKSAVTGATRAMLLPAGVPVSWIIDDRRFLRVIGDAATFLRFWVSSRRPTENR